MRVSSGNNPKQLTDVACPLSVQDGVFLEASTSQTLMMPRLEPEKMFFSSQLTETADTSGWTLAVELLVKV